MSDGNPPDDMFGGLPFMADLMKLLQGQTSGSNDTARQLAHTIANDGQSEPNIDPADRIAVEQLIRVAELQVASLTELSTGPITVEVGNRSQWADRTITDYRPLFETLSDSMSQGLQLPDDLPTGDPMAAMLANSATASNRPAEQTASATSSAARSIAGARLVRASGIIAVAVMLRWRRWRSASELSVEPIRILFTSSFRLSPRPDRNSFGFRRISRQGW